MVQINLRLSKAFLDDIDSTWRDQGFNSRSEFLRHAARDAVKHLVSKLDETVESGWREPDAFLEPLTGGSFSKLRVGQYRLACALDRSGSVLEVRRIEHRSGADTADDD